MASWIAQTALFALFILGCASHDSREPVRPKIADVLQRHSDSLMKVSGVVGVYEGERADKSPVIRIMVIRKTADLERQLPTQLEGYPVEIEETGEIKPMH